LKYACPEPCKYFTLYIPLQLEKSFFLVGNLHEISLRGGKKTGSSWIKSNSVLYRNFLLPEPFLRIKSKNDKVQKENGLWEVQTYAQSISGKISTPGA
jgi:hypothetical protein